VDKNFPGLIKDAHPKTLRRRECVAAGIFNHFTE
jgi:hypothetical protein